MILTRFTDARGLVRDAQFLTFLQAAVAGFMSRFFARWRTLGM